MPVWKPISTPQQAPATIPQTTPSRGAANNNAQYSGFHQRATHSLFKNTFFILTFYFFLSLDL